MMLAESHVDRCLPPIGDIGDLFGDVHANLGHFRSFTGQREPEILQFSAANVGDIY